jgi:prolyl-tRNA editing enzyme YbaK/EbsC (Cys-tRNA(Pro) deacylase)
MEEKLEPSTSLSSSAQKVQEAMKQLGFEYRVVELPATTRSAADAANAIGCKVEQIAKSIVFRTRNTNRPVLVIASGVNRVSEKRIGELLSEPIGKADADFVRRTTGFAIGGVPPLGHLQKMEIFIDEDLLNYDRIWAAAGTPNAVFGLLPADLVKMTGGKVTSIK